MDSHTSCDSATTAEREVEAAEEEEIEEEEVEEEEGATLYGRSSLTWAQWVQTLIGTCTRQGRARRCSGGWATCTTTSGEVIA